MNMIELRQKIRKGEFQTHTSGIQTDCAQYNVVILPKSSAEDFKRFCELNKKPCPVVLMTEAGQRQLDRIGQDVDLATDIPQYKIFESGVFTQEASDISSLWQSDFVGFLLGCSFTFEKALIDAGIVLPHVQAKRNVAMYKTNISLVGVGRFTGKMVVSMRYIKRSEIDKVVDITSQYPNFHGSPVHIGDPEEIGISNITQPDYGQYTAGDAEMIPVFWGCGVTPQLVIENAKLPLVITHSPGCMLIGDISHQMVLDQKY